MGRRRSKITNFQIAVSLTTCILAVVVIGGIYWITTQRNLQVSEEVPAYATSESHTDQTPLEQPEQRDSHTVTGGAMALLEYEESKWRAWDIAAHTVRDELGLVREDIDVTHKIGSDWPKRSVDYVTRLGDNKYLVDSYLYIPDYTGSFDGVTKHNFTVTMTYDDVFELFTNVTVSFYDLAELIHQMAASVSAPHPTPIAGRVSGSTDTSAITTPNPRARIGGSDGDRTTAWAVAQEAVRHQLRSPSTARFPWYNRDFVTYLSNGRYRIEAYVDAQNALGATVRQHFTVTLTLTDTGGTDVSVVFNE